MIVSTSHRVCTMKNIDFTDFFNVFLSGATIQAQRIYLSLGDREEYTKNTIMAAVGDNIRALHHELVVCGKTCTLEWNRGGHFKDADLRTARAFRWVIEDMR